MTSNNMTHFIAEAERRYPATVHHKQQAATLFAKVLQVHYMRVQDNDNLLKALTGTLMYFSSPPLEQHEVEHFLHHLIAHGVHQEKVIACTLVNKINAVKRDKWYIKNDAQIVNHPIAIGYGAQASAGGAAIQLLWKESDLQMHFPWALSNKEIEQCLHDDKSILAVLNDLSNLGMANSKVGLVVGGLKAFYDVLKTKKISIWTGVILGISIILTVAQKRTAEAENGLQKEADYRDLWAKK